jgi:hypothetical protein
MTGESKIKTTIIGAVLITIGSLIAATLLMGGGPILPHIVGPIVFVSIGVLLVTLKRKDGHGG